MTPKVKVNDPCWCGSGQKFKKCHQNRAEQKPLHPKEVDKKYSKFFQRPICLHPDRSRANCNGIIAAHSIQRAGAFAKLINPNNKLFTFYPPERQSDGYLMVHEKGWREASTFRGFCQTHDAIFADIETQPYTATDRQAFLVGYRAVCHEMYQKLAVNAANPLLKQHADVGKPEEIQFEIQNDLMVFSLATDTGYKDIDKMKQIYDKALKSADYSDLNSATIFFDGDISVASTGAVMPDFDLNGNRIQFIEDLSKDIDGLTFGVLATSTGGAFTFSWPAKNRICNQFVKEVITLPHPELASFLVEFMFAYVENTYFSESWWNSLSETKKRKISSLASTPVMYGMHPKYSKQTYTNWQITSITKRIV